MNKLEKWDTNTTRRKLRAKGMKQLSHLWCWPDDVERIKRFVRECNAMNKNGL